MTHARTAIRDFSTSNKIYVNAVVTFYTVAGGAKTTVLATLYTSLTGSDEAANPQDLDSSGKFKAPVYNEVDVIAVVTGLGNTPDHDTGVISSHLNSVDVAITSTELLALQTTVKELVAAPGANKILAFKYAAWFLDYNSTAYAGIAAGENLDIRYTDASGVLVGAQETVGFLDQTSDKHAITYPAVTSGVTDIIAVTNAALVACLSGAIITGNSPLGVRVFYDTIDISTLSAT